MPLSQLRKNLFNSLLGANWIGNLLTIVWNESDWIKFEKQNSWVQGEALSYDFLWKHLRLSLSFEILSYDFFMEAEHYYVSLCLNWGNIC